jgi:hypothetical protein
MSTRKFVSGSSVILAGWLGATFLNEVPAQRYPKLEKKSAVVMPIKSLEPAGTTPDPKIAAFSPTH